ncbi:15.7 kDa heat shock protein, peroxisomal-like [Panicum miliaceum]|uniref:15.7 kDa heat shock protein, peroxisomal-like n=1 Tax=Panicum miliaceum TaxID=4540 RepID=A0A3L6R1B7_PANMI|nr:15.7 kDa heat shock protein, peroxisomal-like [Panicum miliaceum]
MASSCKTQQRAAKGGAAAPAPDACVADIDPKLECLDGATTYIIRLTLPVDRDTRRCLTRHVRTRRVQEGGLQGAGGLRRPADGPRERPAGYVRFHKAFQLPQTAYPDGVAGRFDGTVLSLTVPKQPASGRDMVAARLAKAEECAAARAAGEGTTTWAEALGGKGQMVAAAVAGFALGAFLAHRLLSVTNT